MQIDTLEAPRLLAAHHPSLLRVFHCSSLPGWGWWEIRGGFFFQAVFGVESGHLTFIPYALANVVEDEGDFTVAKGHKHPLISFKRTITMMYEILVFLSCSQLCSWRSQRLLMMFFKGVPHNTSFYYNILCPTFWGIGFRVLEAR
jgi:hypothetical protein